jgi:hypothetical protein
MLILTTCVISLSVAQKVTTFSRSPNPLTLPLLAIGSTSSQLSLLSLPNLSQVLPQLIPENNVENEKGNPSASASKQYEGEEIFDVDFNDKGDMVSSTNEMHSVSSISRDWLT